MVFMTGSSADTTASCAAVRRFYGREAPFPDDRIRAGTYLVHRGRFLAAASQIELPRLPAMRTSGNQEFDLLTACCLPSTTVT